MTWIDPWGNNYSELPDRIRLKDFTTRTSADVTEEVAIAGGWLKIEDPVVIEAVIEPFVIGEETVGSFLSENNQTF
jgi:hypothetical protein